MMPLTLIGIGETATIAKLGGNDEVKRHLEELGFVPGAEITIVSKVHENVIVNVKEARIAISKDMAKKIMV